MSKVISKDIKIAFTVISFNLVKPNVPLWTVAGLRIKLSALQNC